MTNPAVRSAVNMSLADPNFVLYFTYSQWEEAFIERWGVEVLDNGRLATIYIEERKFNPLSMTFNQAALAFHVNILRFKSPEQLVKCEEDYDKVIPEMADIPLTNEDWERVAQQEDLLRDRPKPQVFDMGREKHDA